MFVKAHPIRKCGCLAVFVFALITGCATYKLTTVCRHVAYGQYLAAVEEYGDGNVKVWLMKNKHPKLGYTHHMQVCIRTKSGWRWAPNYPKTVELSKRPQEGCYPVREIKYLPSSNKIKEKSNGT